MDVEIKRMNESDDLVDIADVVRFFLNNKIIILFSIIVSFSLLGVYRLAVDPIYTVRFQLIEPVDSDVERLKHLNAVNMPKKNVFMMFVNNLVSGSVRQQFYNDVNLKELAGGDERSMVNFIAILESFRIDGNSLSFESVDPHQERLIVVRYLEYVERFTANNVLLDYWRNVNAKKDEIRAKIKISIMLSKDKIEYEIKKLEVLSETIQKHSQNLKHDRLGEAQVNLPTYIDYTSNSYLSNILDDVVRIDSKLALMKEIHSSLLINDVDGIDGVGRFYSHEIFKLYEQLYALESVSINADDIRTANIIESANSATARLMKRYDMSMLSMITLFIGLAVGVVLSILLNSIKKGAK